MESSACARHKSFQFLLKSSRGYIAKTLTASFRIFSAKHKIPNKQCERSKRCRDIDRIHFSDKS